MMNSYYRNQLTENNIFVYDNMLRCLKEIENSFCVPACSVNLLSDIFFRIRLDHPEIFYAVSFKCRSFLGSDSIEVLPEYMFDRKKIISQREGLNTRIRKLCAPVVEKDELDKEKYIHDFICTSVIYDKLKKPYSHEIIGPLQNGVGVCEGIAKTVKILCDTLGLNCIIAVSNADGNSKYLHAWNVIKIKNTYYHMDSTFDNSLSSPGIIRYDYLNLGDLAIFRDHNSLKYTIPVCNDNKNFYYKAAKLSFTDEKEVFKRFSQAIKKKKSGFIFQWRAGYLTRTKLNELLLPCLALSDEMNMPIECKINFPQAVVEFIFGVSENTKFIEQNSAKLIYGDDV